LTDIHLTDRRNEGIKGIDPVRFGRFVAGVNVDTNDRDIEKGRSFIGIHINIHNCAAMQYLSIWLILKMMKIYD